MPSFSQQDKKTIAPKIKALAQEYGVKCSLSVRHHTTVVLTVSAGELDFVSDYNKSLAEQNKTREPDRKHNLVTDGYIDICKNTIEEDFTGKCKAFLVLARQILMSVNYYEESNPIDDYYRVAYYIEIDVGRYNKPYVYTPKQ